MKKLFMKTITTTTAGGSTELPAGLAIVDITNNDATNFTTLSVEGAIGSANEAVLLATKSLDFSNANENIGGSTNQDAFNLYWKSNTADVSVTILGYLV